MYISGSFSVSVLPYTNELANTKFSIVIIYGLLCKAIEQQEEGLKTHYEVINGKQK